MKYINSYNLFLNEAINDNFLYHSTSIPNLIKILDRNTIKTAGSNENISFSRNKNFWFNNIQKNSVRLVLDKRKLSSNYKIDNFDFYGSSKKWDEETQRFKYTTSALTKSDSFRRLKKLHYEFEEVVWKDITNLGKYLYEIELTDVALGLHKDYKSHYLTELDEMKKSISNYLIKYPHIKISIVDIDNKYINGGEIFIKNKYDYDKEI